MEEKEKAGYRRDRDSRTKKRQRKQDMGEIAKAGHRIDRDSRTR